MGAALSMPAPEASSLPLRHLPELLLVHLCMVAKHFSPIAAPLEDVRVPCGYHRRLLTGCVSPWDARRS